MVNNEKSGFFYMERVWKYLCMYGWLVGTYDPVRLNPGLTFSPAKLGSEAS